MLHRNPNSLTISISIGFHPSYRCETARMILIRRVKLSLCVHNGCAYQFFLLILHEETRSFETLYLARILFKYR